MNTLNVLTAGLLAAAIAQPLPVRAGSTDAAAHAQSVLHRYTVAFTLHYLCGRNPLAGNSFNQIPAEQLSPEWAFQYSPTLMVLAGLINSDHENLKTACSTRGLFADQYDEVELSDAFINGLRILDRHGDARLAFENGTWFRLTGHRPGFERYVEQLINRLSPLYSQSG